MKKMTSLEDLFMDELKDIYNAEKQLTKALPKMAKAATSQELKSAFREHLEQTNGQIERLEKVFESLGAKAKGKTCKAMEGLIEEGKELMEEDAEPSVKDAALISAAQKVEHYEIGSYGTLATFARMLGYGEAASLLKETLAEEKETDSKLTKIAQTKINIKAAKADKGSKGGGSGATKGGSKSAAASGGSGRSGGSRSASSTSGGNSSGAARSQGSSTFSGAIENDMSSVGSGGNSPMGDRTGSDANTGA